MCGYIPLDCTEHPHSVNLAGASSFVYFWMWKSVPCSQKSSGYTNHINYEENQHRTKKAWWKMTKDSDLLPIRYCIQETWYLKLGVKMSSVQNHDLTEYFLFLFFLPWFHISSRHIRRITLDIYLEILLAVSKYSHLKSHNHLLFYRTVSQKFRRSLDVWF